MQSMFPPPPRRTQSKDYKSKEFLRKDYKYEFTIMAKNGIVKAFLSSIMLEMNLL